MRKKTISLCLSVIMVFSLATPVFAKDVDADTSHDVIEDIVDSDEILDKNVKDTTDAESEQIPDQNVTEEKSKTEPDNLSETEISETENSNNEETENAENTVVKTLSEETAFAVYSEDDNSLTFYVDNTLPEDGETYNDKTVSNVYTEFVDRIFEKANSTEIPWYSIGTSVQSVIIDTSFEYACPVGLAYWFYNFTDAEFYGLENINTSEATSMKYTFYNCTSLTNVDGVAEWDTSKVTTFYYLFCNCKALTSIDGLAKWDTSNVTDMPFLFTNCQCLTNVDALADWDTSNVTTLVDAFEKCYALESIDGLSDWDVSSVTTLKFTFSECSSLKSADPIGSWDVSNVTTLNSTFKNCSSMESAELGEWDISSVTDLKYIFDDCSSLTSIDSLAAWDMSEISSLLYMFYGCASLTNVDALSAWDLGSATELRYVFYGCTGLTNVDALSVWDTSSATSLAYMFGNCSGLESVDVLSAWNISNVASLEYFVKGCSNLKTVDLTGWDTAGVTKLSYMFSECTGLTAVNVSSFDTSNVSDMQYMFNGCTALATIYSDDDNFVTNGITSSSKGGNMFKNCTSLVGGNGTAFSSSKITYTMAHVDVSGNSGYFTQYEEGICLHDYVGEVTKTATCTEGGAITYTCTKCGDMYTESIPATGHDYQETERTEASCTEDGSIMYTCENCGDLYKETINTTGHDYEVASSTAATCIKDGSTTYTCKNCGDSYTEPISATGHTVVTDKAVSATCTSTGLTEGSHCSSCGEVLSKQSTMAKLGHNYKSSVSGFVKTYKCSRCNDSYTEKLYPSLKSVTANASSITVSWKSLDNAKGYAVFRKSGKNGSWKRIATTTSTSYKDTESLSNGTTYYYTVRAYKGSQSTALKNTYSDSYWSTYSSNGISFTYTKTPSISKITNTESGIKASWSKVSGAKGYAVYRKTKNGSWKRLGTTTSTSYTDKTAKSGTTYYYTVRAYRGSKTDALNNTYNAKYWSGYKSSGSKARFMSTPGSLKVTTNKKSKRVVKWSGVKNASGYAVFRKQGKNGSWKLIGTTTKKSYTDKSRLKKGKMYYYTVRAYNGKAKTAKKNKWASYYWSSYKTSGVSFKAK